LEPALAPAPAPPRASVRPQTEPADPQARPGDGEQHCGYLAVLPASPSTPAHALEAAVRALEAPAVSLRWLDARTAQLEHPQLPTPLDYIEITCGITLATAELPDGDPQRDAAAQSALQQIADALMTAASVVGNAEVVHSIRSPMPLLPAALPVITASELRSTDGGERAERAFRRFGLVGIRDAVSPSVLPVAKACVLEQFEKTLSALKRREGAGEGVHFAEIMQRDKNRYDCQLSASFSLAAAASSAPEAAAAAAAADSDGAAPIWESLAREGAWVPMVRKLLQGGSGDCDKGCKVYRCGCVVSLPGAEEQYWHSDGDHRGAAAGWPPCSESDSQQRQQQQQQPAEEGDAAAGRQDLSAWGQSQAANPHNVCVFIPLVDLSHTNGYTEFWAGSQHYSKLFEKKGVQALPGGTDAIVDAGDALLYDFRTVHRGMPNSSDAMRPILYIVYSHDDWSESRNFRVAAGSVFAGAAAAAAAAVGRSGSK
jgi:hypothetical protein